VGKGISDLVKAVPEQKVGITIPRGEEKTLSTEMELVPIVNAPVKKGQLLGHISILKNGEIIQRTNLVANEDVSKGSYWKMVKKVFCSVASGE
jgi:D-alanyl-D-alanine carboxypeptidase (penicillin-binding protein 5/6)